MASLLIALFASGRSLYVSHKKKRDEKRKQSLASFETREKGSSSARRNRRNRVTAGADKGRANRRPLHNTSRTAMDQDEEPRLSQQSTLADRDIYGGG